MMVKKVSFVSENGYTSSLCPEKWEICHIEHATPRSIFLRECGDMCKKLVVDGFLAILPASFVVSGWHVSGLINITIEYDVWPTESYTVNRQDNSSRQSIYRTPKHGNILLKSVTDGYQPREFTDEEIDEICGCYE